MHDGVPLGGGGGVCGEIYRRIAEWPSWRMNVEKALYGSRIGLDFSPQVLASAVLRSLGYFEDQDDEDAAAMIIFGGRI